MVSDVAVDSLPIVTASLGGETSGTTVIMSRIPGASRAYKGAYQFTQAGTVNITTRVMQANVDTTNTRTFGVTLAKPGVDQNIITLDGQVNLRIGDNAIYTETYFITETREAASETVYNFGPALTFDEPQKLEFNFDETSVIDPGKLFIYQKKNDEWIQLESQVFTSIRKVRVHVQSLGEFKLGYDASFTGSNIIPSVYALGQNYPNPFNPTTTIQYDLPEDGQAQLVIYNMLGQAVKTLPEGFQLAGRYNIQWDATNSKGSRIASGVYFYTLKVGEFSQTKKMLLLK